MAFSTFLILSGFLAIISVWIYFIIEILRGNVKWSDERNIDTFMSTESISDFEDPFDDYDHQRRICDAVNISHGHPPGVPYIRS